MPGPDFFRNLGFFVRSNFFDSDSCSRIRREMIAAESYRALILAPNCEKILDEQQRKVLEIGGMKKSTKALVEDRIISLKPALEEHFRITLGDIQEPTFLRYGEGAFYKRHKDTHPDDLSNKPHRRVSLVVFLNARSQEPSANCYAGGSLTFYGVLEGQDWEKCTFSLEAELGLLIAFRSEMLHEVRPVTFGERFTIVTWFLA